MNGSLISQLELNRDRNKAELARILSTAQGHGRDNLSSGETERVRTITEDNVAIGERITELQEQDQRDVAAGQVIQRYQTGFGAGIGGARVNDAATYRPDGQHSFFLDSYRATQGDSGARERLDRNIKQRTESRAISTTTGAGGEFVPPLWLEEDWISIARAGRTTADLLNNLPMPGGTNVVNIPKVNSGTAVALQGTQNTAIQQTDLTTTSVNSGVFTVAGGQTISMQLVEQSPGHADKIIMKDLAADYNRKVGNMVLNDTTAATFNGIIASAGNTTAYTDAAPALMGPGKLYAKIAQAKSVIETTLFLPPDAIIMHPRRWDWICVQVDSSNRPAVLPDQQGPFNASGIVTSTEAQGSVGKMFGLPVYLDPQIAINTGAGTNQDTIVLLRTDESWFWESHLRLEAFAQTYAQNLSLFVRCYSYVAQLTRRASSIALITGTGLITPTF